MGWFGSARTGFWRHRAWRVLLTACLVLSASALHLPGVAAQGAPATRFDGWADWETLNGAFYTQGAPTDDPTRGFSVTDEGGKYFWRSYVALGGR